MIYSNDEADKSARKKRYYLNVYALPVGLTASICGFIYWSATENYLPKEDAIYGYMLAVIPGIFLSANNKKNWLKMPDGTFHNVKGISPTNIINHNEPIEYEEEYGYSKKEKIISIVTGIVLLVVGIWLQMNSSESILIPVGTIVMGLILFYSGIKGLRDKTAKLKLAKNGLWTNKLGFVNYNEIKKAQVIEETKGRTQLTYLEIYLKGTVFAEAEKPDEKLYLSDIEDKQFVEMTLTNLMKKHTELNT